MSRVRKKIETIYILSVTSVICLINIHFFVCLFFCFPIQTVFPIGIKSHLDMSYYWRSIFDFGGFRSITFMRDIYSQYE